MMTARRSLTMGFVLLVSLTTSAFPGKECERVASVKVDCTTASAFLNIDIAHCRRIGHIVIEVRNKDGIVLYREEGKALADVLVRRLDKGVFPKEELSLSVTARDFSITQPFSIR